VRQDRDLEPTSHAFAGPADVNDLERSQLTVGISLQSFPKLREEHLTSVNQRCIVWAPQSEVKCFHESGENERGKKYVADVAKEIRKSL
jgi:hypothetical protein